MIMEVFFVLPLHSLPSIFGHTGFLALMLKKAANSVGSGK
jgi:hypothetical protein